MNFNDNAMIIMIIHFIIFPPLGRETKHKIILPLTTAFLDTKRRGKSHDIESLYMEKEHDIAICWCYLERLGSLSFQMHEKIHCSSLTFILWRKRPDQ